MMFRLNHPLRYWGEGREGTAGMMKSGQGLALGVPWNGLGGARGGCCAHGHDHSTFVLTALSTALGEGQLEANFSS